MIQRISKVLYIYWFFHFTLIQHSYSIEFAERSPRVVPQLKTVQGKWRLIELKCSDENGSALLLEKNKFIKIVKHDVTTDGRVATLGTSKKVKNYSENCASFQHLKIDTSSSQVVFTLRDYSLEDEEEDECSIPRVADEFYFDAKLQNFNLVTTLRSHPEFARKYCPTANLELIWKPMKGECSYWCED